MRKVKLLYSKEVTLEDNRVMKLEYNITENQNTDTDEPYYGIQIVKYLGENRETEEIEGISYSREKVEAIVKILFQNIVTPISMVEIVDDIITLESV